jgi:hypothetical protein
MPLFFFVQYQCLSQYVLDFRFPPTRSVRELQLLYAIAVTRFVNGIVEREQTGVHAKSIASIADRCVAHISSVSGVLSDFLTHFLCALVHEVLDCLVCLLTSDIVQHTNSCLRYPLCEVLVKWHWLGWKKGLDLFI